MIIESIEKLNASLEDFLKIYLDTKNKKVILYPMSGKIKTMKKKAESMPGARRSENGDVSFSLGDYEVIVKAYR